MAETRTAIEVDDLLASADWLRVLAGRILPDESEVDDLVHDAWLAALRRPSEAVRHLPSWLAGVVCNLSRRRANQSVRQQELRHESALALEDGAPGPDEVFDLELLRRRVLSAVLDLPDPFRATVLMTFYQGLPPHEIARRTGVPAATVRSRLNRALHRLRRQLEDESRDSRAHRLGLILLARLPVSTAKPLLPSFGLAAAAGILAVFALALGSGWEPGGASALEAETEGGRELVEGPAAPAAGEEPDAPPESLAIEAGADARTGSVDDHGSECGGGLRIGEELFELDGGGALPQPAMRKEVASTGAESSDSSGPGAIEGAARANFVALLPTPAAHASFAAPTVPFQAPDDGGRAARQRSRDASARRWSSAGPPMVPQGADEEEEEDEDEGEHLGFEDPSLALHEDPDGTDVGQRSKSPSGGSTSDEGVGSTPGLTTLCLCPERTDTRARLLLSERKHEARPDEPPPPPRCPRHADERAERTLWQRIDLPGASLVAGWDERALLERPWDALAVLGLVEVAPVEVGPIEREAADPRAGAPAREPIAQAPAAR